MHKFWNTWDSGSVHTSMSARKIFWNLGKDGEGGEVVVQYTTWHMKSVMEVRSILAHRYPLYFLEQHIVGETRDYMYVHMPYVDVYEDYFDLYRHVDIKPHDVAAWEKRAEQCIEEVLETYSCPAHLTLYADVVPRNYGWYHDRLICFDPVFVGAS